MIPTDISQSCSDFLTALNSDDDLAACTAPLLSATSAYGPLSKNLTEKPTLADLDSTLDTLCSPSTASCPSTLIRTKLTEFYANCTDELTSNPNDDVILTYDVLYALTPLKQVVCSKDDNGTYCVTESTPPPTTQHGTSQKRDTADQTAFVPNATTVASTNLFFLFLTGQEPASQLCTTCTKEVISAFIDAESNQPYAPGLGQSRLFPGQTMLYQGIENTCGQSFLSGAVQAAGGLGSNGILGNKSKTSGARSSRELGFVATIVGAVVIGFAWVL